MFASTTQVLFEHLVRLHELRIGFNVTRLKLSIKLFKLRLCLGLDLAEPFGISLDDGNDLS